MPSAQLQSLGTPTRLLLFAPGPDTQAPPYPATRKAL